MSLNIAPFTGLSSATTSLVAGSTTKTMTFQASALPYTAVRISNIGTAAAFIQFIDTANTTTVGATNAQPVINNTSVVLNPGGQQAMAYVTNSTFTTTIFVTAGQGGTAR